MNKKELGIISTKRKSAKLSDSPELQKTRENFLCKLLIQHSDVEFLEMYPCGEGEVVKSKPSRFQYINEGEFCNTRTKIPTETKCELDKLGFAETNQLIIETCHSLMRSKISFNVFYSLGGRSPYIIIYDWKDLENLSSYKKVKAQVMFWKKHVPMGCFKYVDTGLFDEEHLQPLEFSIHWKHGTPFDLLFSYHGKEGEYYAEPLI